MSLEEYGIIPECDIGQREEYARLRAEIRHWQEAGRSAVEAGNMLMTELKRLRAEVERLQAQSDALQAEVERLRARVEEELLYPTTNPPNTAYGES